MPDRFPFHVASISHQAAPLAVRERVTLGEEAIRELLTPGAVPVARVPLSTCNRTECYHWGPADARPVRSLAVPPAVVLSGLPAIRHLFAVAAGLESQLVGESEILGQVRRAWLRARDAGATNLPVNLIFSHALSAGRRVRRETWLGSHAFSVMEAAVRQVLGGTMPGRVVVLGAGEAARGVLRALEAEPPGSVTVVCRRPDAARRFLPRRAGWGVAAWETLDREVAGADVILAATAASRPVLFATHLDGQRCTVLDLGVPRNVDTGVRSLPGVRLVDLDDLRGHGCLPREELLEGAWAIVDEELDRLVATLRARTRSERLAQLHEEAARIADEEAERALMVLDGLGEAEQQLVRQLASRVMKRVLYPASRAIREV